MIRLDLSIGVRWPLGLVYEKANDTHGRNALLIAHGLTQF